MKPSPVPQFIVCSVCDLPWSSHSPDPTLMDCIKLLKQRTMWNPRPRPWYDVTYYGTTGMLQGSNPIATNAASSQVQYRTPKEN